MRVENLKRDWLEITDWKVGDGEIWCLHGGNASGKTWLASLLSGEVEADSGAIHERPKRTRCVSFETQQAVYQKEIANDDTDYLGRIDTGTTVREMLQQGGCSEGDVQLAAKSFSLEATLDRGYRLLSSGEARKIMLLREFMAKPDLLILDEPFEGLDAEASEAFSTACAAAISEGLQIMLFINRVEDIQDWTTHLALLSRGRLVAQGPREAVLSSSEVQQMLSLDRGPLPDLPTPATSELSVADPLVIFQNVKVQYGATIQFQKFDWTLAKGEHTVVTGPNGAGKSTLLQLLTGDHPQCYSNRIQIFGYQRGSGESIWDIKRLIGIVSPALHRDYRVSADVLSVVVSGCYDTIGLYRSPSPEEKRLARSWLNIFGLADWDTVSFHALSYGQQRLCLIARGLIKQPPLLVLDEPTQGLDDLNRHLVLDCIERLAEQRRTTLLFVSHRTDERPKLFKHRLRFRSDPTLATLYKIEQERLK